jgi:hypothetical protein
MSQGTHSGYLVLGDISGYTSYLATTELEHAEEILSVLLELVVARFEPLLTVVRLEGDAVFAHAPEGFVPRGETLVELLESTYVAFRDYIRGVVHRTSCDCSACRNIPALDLKFIVHFGDYVVQQVSRNKELVGTDVNRLFRLSKNHVSQQTGWNAYILYTAAGVDRLGLEPEGMHRHVESHEYLGELVTYAVDLHALYDEVTSARYVLLSPEEAHATLTLDLPAPQPLAWEWLNDPLRRNELMPGVVWSASDRPGGRTGTGATNHCAHGKNGLVCETILDWRPFEYATSLSTSGKLPDRLMDMTQTVLLQPVDGGEKTRVAWRVRMERLPGWLARRLLAPRYLQAMRKQYVEPLDRMIQQAVAVRQETAVDRAAVATSETI